LTKQIKAIVSGCAGRMGIELVRAISGSKDFILSAGIEKKDHPLLGKDAGMVAGIGELEVKISEERILENCSADLLIEFTQPEPTLAHLKIAQKRKLPAVVGTTGFSEAQKQELKQIAKVIPLLVSPNLSTGVNVLFFLVKQAVRLLGPSYDLEVIEAHHQLKKDAPSGTAIRLAEILAEARGWKLEQVACYHRQGMTGARPEAQIGIQTIRAGDIVGEHTVLLAGIGERIELTHRAGSRQSFAQGALRASLWLINQPPGLYSMQDCLGIK